MLSPCRRSLNNSSPSFHPFCVSPSWNAIQDLYIQPDSINTQVIFLNCSDLQPVLQTVTGVKKTNCMNLLINDDTALSLARNVAILSIISSPEFDPSDMDNIEYLWDIWYNTMWPEKTKVRFILDIEALLSYGSQMPANIAPLPLMTLQNLRVIWADWLLALNGSLSNTDNVVNIFRNRTLIVYTGWVDRLKYQVCTAAELKKQFDSAFAKDLGISHYPQELREAILLEGHSYFFLTTNCSVKEDVNICLNPMLLEPFTHRWIMPFSAYPLNGYLPFNLPDLIDSFQTDERSVKGPSTRHCQKRLQALIVAFRHSMHQIKFIFHLEDPLELCYANSSDFNFKFDVVHCSPFLADQFGLANILNATGQILSPEPESILLTESSNWSSLAPTVGQYVEESLCVPLSMLPTIYGVRLADPSNPSRLVWRRVPVYKNVRLDLMPSLKPYLDQLAAKCFVDTGRRQKQQQRKKQQMDFSGLGQEKCGLSCYTPQTYNYILANAADRAGVGYDPKVPEDRRFSLTQRTSNHWNLMTKAAVIAVRLNFGSEQMSCINQHLTQFPRIVRYSAAVPLDLILLDSNTVAAGQPLLLRLLLLPAALYLQLKKDEPVSLTSQDDDVHYIDNIYHRWIKNESSEQQLQGVGISFILVDDHGLSDTHCAVAIDLRTGKPVVPLGSFDSLKKEPFHLANSFTECGSAQHSDNIFNTQPEEERRVAEGSSGDQPQTPCMHLGTCLEMEGHYDVNIIITGQGPLEELKLSTDRQAPCESAHSLTFSFFRPVNMRPFTITLPFPFLADSSIVYVSQQQEQRSLRIVLRKALSEPWPGDFSCSVKWPADDLQVFGPTEHLHIHLDRQFNLTTEMNPILREVRLIIAGIFQFAMFHSVVTIRCLEGEPLDTLSMPDWWLKVHQPVLVSPQGSPMLILSAYDRRMASKLAANGRLDLLQAEDDIERICLESRQIPDDQQQPAGASLVTRVVGVARLLRHVFRLNSTKLAAKLWQTENLPVGEHSPWLATFVSPLYTDIVRSQSSTRGFEIFRGFNHCAKCLKLLTRSKLCSRCLIARYCSVKCKQADEKRHKASCKKPVHKETLV